MTSMPPQIGPSLTSCAQVKESLVCPIHRRPLLFPASLGSSEGVPWADGAISCPEGCRFEVIDGIPRFVTQSNYATAFGVQWKRYRRTQLDSYTGLPISRVRLERCLGMPLKDLAGTTVLEVGAGAGRFTELLIPACGLLVSTDLSAAVEANLANCREGRPYLLVQSDINKSPLPYRAFDVVICMGVLQHTPSPEETIKSLAAHVKPGGLLVIDHYTRRNRLSRIGSWITLARPLRAILKRLSPERGLQATIRITAICDPIRRLTCKISWLDRIVGRILPSACYYNLYPELDPAIIYEFNELDTHDALTDFHKHYRSCGELKACLEALGFSAIWCSRFGTYELIEARGRYAGAHSA